MTSDNVSMIDAAPNYALTSSAINWGSYITYAVECMLNGEEIPVDWCQGHSENAVYLTELNSAAIAEGTEEKVEEVWAAIDSGELKVFDTSTWTVGGETITSTKDLEGFNGIEYIQSRRILHGVGNCVCTCIHICNRRHYRT